MYFLQAWTNKSSYIDLSRILVSIVNDSVHAIARFRVINLASSYNGYHDLSQGAGPANIFIHIFSVPVAPYDFIYFTPLV